MTRKMELQSEYLRWVRIRSDAIRNERVTRILLCPKCNKAFTFDKGSCPYCGYGGHDV